MKPSYCKLLITDKEQLLLDNVYVKSSLMCKDVLSINKAFDESIDCVIDKN